jgi:GT2 family glycosyltransferase
MSMSQVLTSTKPITVFIHSYNRPLYLWASLDSLYRGTQHPHRFVFIDMASDDPFVRQVVAGFERRGMFCEVVWSPRGDVNSFWALLWPRLEEAGPIFAYCQTDVIVERTNPCWLTTFASLMQGAPRLAMLGSVIDKDDFVGFDEARRLEPRTEDQRLRAMIKWFSPERAQNPSAAQGPIFSSHNPAGRLLMLRTEALVKVGMGDDRDLHEKFIAAGYDTGIATAVRHRHLSLLHIYDYPQYDYDRRDAYCQGRSVGEEADEPPTACP